MPQMNEYNTAEGPSMSKVAIGNIIPDPKVIEALREATEKRHKVGKKADSEAWRRSKNKAYRRKMARQRGVSDNEFRHTRKKGR